MKNLRKQTRPEEAREAALQGAALLDEHRPGWEREIDLATLQMSCPKHCMLGKLFGSYQAGRAVLNLPRTEQVVAVGFYEPRQGSGYEPLTVAWTEIIQARRQASRTMMAVQAPLPSKPPVGAAERVPEPA